MRVMSLDFRLLSVTVALCLAHLSSSQWWLVLGALLVLVVDVLRPAHVRNYSSIRTDCTGAGSRELGGATHALMLGNAQALVFKKKTIWSCPTICTVFL